MENFQTTNMVIVEGILSEINLENYEYTRDNVTKDVIRGNIIVKVRETIEDEKKELFIPVQTFVAKTTNKGTANPAYENMQKVMNEFVSIAAAGNEEEATRVRVTGASIQQNEYYSPDGSKLNSYPRISGSFVNKVKAEDMKERAIWEVQLYINKLGYAFDKDGIETNVFEVEGVSIAYNGSASIIKLVTTKPDYAQAIQNSYEIGQTVSFSGKLDFSSTTETFLEKVEIGEDIEKRITKNVSNLVITGVKPPMEEGLSQEGISKALADRLVALEKKKTQATATAGETKAPSQTATSAVDW